MIIQSRYDIETNKTFINVILNQEELERLVGDKVISMDDHFILCQIIVEVGGE